MPPNEGDSLTKPVAVAIRGQRILQASPQALDRGELHGNVAVDGPGAAKRNANLEDARNISWSKATFAEERDRQSSCFY